MILDSNKDKGRAGLSLAIAYFGSNGYTVSLPLNDTQDYDLVVDKDNKLSKVQIKFTNECSTYGVYVCSLRSISGTTRQIISTVKDTSVDLLFIATSDMSLYLIPKEDIISSSTINLGKKYEKYKVFL